MPNKLKPCPKCGKRVRAKTWPVYNEYGSIIGKTKAVSCCVRTEGHDTTGEAIDAWNRGETT